MAYASDVARYDYWKDFYDRELEVFKNSACEGEEWFEAEVSRIVDWLIDLVPSRSSSVLDLGCGNSLFLHRLADEGFQVLAGCDYVPAAIELSFAIWKKRLETSALSDAQEEDTALPAPLTVRLSAFDLTRVISLSNTESASSLLPERYSSGDRAVSIVSFTQFMEDRFDVIHDKGTFDIFFMRHDTLSYIRSICHMLRFDTGLLCITSCNATEEELIKTFCEHEIPKESFSPNQCLKFELHSQLPHRCFTFGGSQGQIVATAAFRLRRV